jgi:hypothetical protein
MAHLCSKAETRNELRLQHKKRLPDLPDQGKDFVTSQDRQEAVLLRFDGNYGNSLFCAVFNTIYNRRNIR